MHLIMNALSPTTATTAAQTLEGRADTNAVFLLIVLSLGFALGVINALITLILRRWRYQEAGTRWSAGFWGALLWAPLTLVITHKILGMGLGLESEGYSLTLRLLLVFALNAGGVGFIARWAARE